MSWFSGIGSIFDPSGARQANNASGAVSNALNPNSPYWQAAQVSDDGSILAGAADLQNTNVGAKTGNLDADSAVLGNIGNIYGGITDNGGQLTQAIQHQAASELANTASSKLNQASRAQSGNVLAQDQAERNWAAAGQRSSKFAALQNELQKQVWKTASSHANFEAAMAGKGIYNADSNLRTGLALGASEAANAGRNQQGSINLQQNAQEFANAMAAIRAAGGAASGITSTALDQYNAGLEQQSTVSVAPDFSFGAQSYDGGTKSSAGYASPSINSQRLAAVTPTSKYVNPITGNTVDPNLPTDTSSWGDWLTGSSLVA